MSSAFRSSLILLELTFLLSCSWVAENDAQGLTGGAVKAVGYDATGDSGDWRRAACTEFNGAYARRSNFGVVCCGNETLNLPLELEISWSGNDKLTSCTLDMVSYEDKDFAHSLWNVSLCVFKMAGAFPEGKLSFENYFKFVTKEYPEPMRKKLKPLTDKCKPDIKKAKDDAGKLQKYTECIHKIEHEACHLPYAKSESAGPLPEDSPKMECKGLEGLYGRNKPEYCCKKESLPFSFEELYLNFPLTDAANEGQMNCSATFVDRQITLNPELKKQLELIDTAEISENATASEHMEEEIYNATSQLDHCMIACDFTQESYVNEKGLKLDYEKAVSLMIKEFGKNTEDLNAILTGRKAQYLFVDPEMKKPLTFKALTQEFQKANEYMKIRLYCSFYRSIYHEIERALHEHCYDKAYADSWFNSMQKLWIETMF